MLCPFGSVSFCTCTERVCAPELFHHGAPLISVPVRAAAQRRGGVWSSALTLKALEGAGRDSVHLVGNKKLSVVLNRPGTPDA